MTKTTEEYLKSMTKEIKFLTELHDNLGKRIENIEESIDEVYELIDNNPKYYQK